MGRGTAARDKNLDNLKQELELDVHKVPIEELCKRFKTDISRGLTDSQAKRSLAEYGPNALTPPPTTPGYKKVCFQLLFINQVTITSNNHNFPLSAEAMIIFLSSFTVALYLYDFVSMFRMGEVLSESFFWLCLSLVDWSDSLFPCLW